MKTVSVRFVRSMYAGVIALAIGGMVSGVVVNSFGGTISCFCLLVFLVWLMEHMWVYAAKDAYILINGGYVDYQVKESCFLAVSSLPEVYEMYNATNELSTTEVELFVHSAAEGGIVIPLTITIGAALGGSSDEFGRYFRYFKRDKHKGKEYIGDLIRHFQLAHNLQRGVFGEINGAHIGTKEWVDNVLIVKLWNFLQEEFNHVGLRVTAIGVIVGSGAKSILLERKG